jgi:hypothetical protein
MTYLYEKNISTTRLLPNFFLSKSSEAVSGGKQEGYINIAEGIRTLMFGTIQILKLCLNGKRARIIESS